LKLLLYNPVSNGARKRIMPFSVLAIGAALDGLFEYEIVDGNAEADPARTLSARIGRGDITVFGVTVMPGPQLEDGYAQTKMLRATFPRLLTIWGGYFATEHTETCVSSGLVDFSIRGHGEEAIVHLLTRILKGADPRDEASAPPQGVAYRRRDGSLAIGPVARVPNPGALPDFPFHKIDVAAYPRPTFLGSRTLGYHSSYGCPFLCNFCGVVSLTSGRWEAQSPERVERVLSRYAREWGVNAVEFYDNNFFTYEARCREIAERIAPLKFRWWGEGRIDTLLKFSDTTWRAMRESGLTMVFLGAESGSAETLARMKKGGALTPQMTLDLAARMHSFGVVPEFSFVLGNPPDPRQDVETTLSFVKTVKLAHPEAEIVLYQYTPVPVEGDLLNAASSTGFAFPKTLDEWVNARWREVSRRNSAQLPWLDAALSLRIQNFRRVLNAYHPTSTDPGLRGWKRRLLRLASSWRYRHDVYAMPIELRLLQRVLRYQRPETAGF
jgi:anaerobic magnesium-protoporphyrin IX monomethyl ester cyclase